MRPLRVGRTKDVESHEPAKDFSMELLGSSIVSYPLRRGIKRASATDFGEVSTSEFLGAITSVKGFGMGRIRS
jgi:hypothetical protein